MSQAAAHSIRETIVRHGLDAKRSLGQHFLLDLNITTKIASMAGDLQGRDVVEVGPGPGGLTRALLDSAARRVIAVEIDRRAIAAIRELQADHPGRLQILEADAMRQDLSALCDSPRQIVANLPYNVGTPLLVGWLRQAGRWERMTLMFQMEVAERICAAADTEAYGRLSVLAQWCCAATVMMRLPPGAFSPPPKVFSAVIGLVPHAVQPPPDLFGAMERLTAAAFGQRRKMLRSALKPLGGDALLSRAEIDSSRRAETLTVGEYDRLVRLL